MNAPTFVKVPSSLPASQAAGDALRNAGLGVVEVDSWEAAQEALRDRAGAVVVCDGPSLAAYRARTGPMQVPRDVARTLSHELRTPLSAMAGWLHLLDSGTLDDAGLKRAVAKLRGNLEDQVRTIERYLGASQEGHD